MNEVQYTIAAAVIIPSIVAAGYFIMPSKEERQEQRINAHLQELKDKKAAERAGLASAPYHVQYQLLLSRPFLLALMVLLAGTVSLKSFRSGGIQTMVVVGIIGGISFFLMVEVSRQIGVAGLVAPWVAVWVPILVAFAFASTIILHQEDG